MGKRKMVENFKIVEQRQLLENEKHCRALPNRINLWKWIGFFVL